MPRHQVNGLSQLSGASIHRGVNAHPTCRDIENARAEIARLKLELAQAREELENLSEATSDFVRLML
jgi:hypothetical protein